jgi:GntR family transcriptional regulator, transcriptional repressor for pyruvate dehydrogenase complex
MQKNTIQPILRQKNLSIRVANRIEEMIRNSELKIGEKIPPERVLCEKFQVSRTVIREATRYLMAKGLLYSQAGDGTYVRNVESGDVSDYLGLHISMQDSPASIEDFMEIRRALEIQIAQFAAERAKESDIQLLEKILQDMHRYKDSPREFGQKDLEFHIVIARASQNPLFEILLNPLMDSLLEVINMALKYDKAVTEAIYFHSLILQKIKERDAQGAGMEMANHLVQSKQAVAYALKNQKNKNNELQKNDWLDKETSK